MEHGVGVLLLSAVAGYWVLERAETHKKGLRQIGRLLGAAIIIASVVGAACRIWYAATCGPSSSGMRGGFCPFSSKMPAAPPTR